MNELLETSCSLVFVLTGSVSKHQNKYSSEKWCGDSGCLDQFFFSFS